MENKYLFPANIRNLMSSCQLFWAFAPEDATNRREAGTITRENDNASMDANNE